MAATRHAPGQVWHLADMTTAPWYRRVVTFASLMVLGTWTLPASSEPNEMNVPRPCSEFARFCELIKQEAKRTGLDPALVDAVIKVESDYRPDTIGAAGEIGLMQVLPSTARLLGFGGTD